MFLNDFIFGVTELWRCALKLMVLPDGRERFPECGNFNTLASVRLAFAAFSGTSCRGLCFPVFRKRGGQAASTLIYRN